VILVERRDGSVPVFSQAEMDRRHAHLRQRMDAQGLDGVLATSYAAFYYLTGAPIHPFGRPMAVVVPRDGEPVIVESIIERGHTRLQSRIEDIRVYYDNNPTPALDNPRPPVESLVYHLAQLVNERGLANRRIGVEEATLPLGHYEALRKALPAAELVGASDLLDRLRLVLSAEELALVRAADAAADLGQQMALDLIRPGRTAYEVTAPIEAAMREHILRTHADMPFHLHARLGLGSAAKGSGHSEWTTWGLASRVEPGQILETVFSVWLWGYWGNVERAVAVGEPAGRQRALFEIMVEMNEAVIAAVRPGLPVAEIDRMCKARFARHDLPTPTGAGCGRGITSYEGNARELKMDLRLYSDVVLEPGMAFSLEPHVHAEGAGVFRHCNTIIVTPDGCEVDSKVPRGVLWV
jgi:creatinase